MSQMIKVLLSFYLLGVGILWNVCLAAEPLLDLLQNQELDSAAPVVQNRQVIKARRFQLGMGMGYSDRNDLYSHLLLSVSGRYHFTEFHAWEVIRIYTMLNQASSVFQEAFDQANLKPDVQQSCFQVVSSYVFTPIYGKYSWTDLHTIYFDIFATVGGGLRFADQLQPVLEVGLGMNHYLFKNRLSIVPEFRVRGYSEARTRQVGVIEHLGQLGVAWIF